MFCYPKISSLKLSNKNNLNSDGFTLLELLMAVAVMGITSSTISFAVSSMITSNQSLAKEQNRRVEVSRAMDLIANDIRTSEIKSGRTLPTGVSNPVLDMDTVVSATSCVDRIVYSIKSSVSGEIGPNVLYRYGRIPGQNGILDCGSTNSPRNVAIADGISTNNSIANITASITETTCSSPAVSSPASPPTGVNGFYSCVSDNQASIALFSKLSPTKTYVINRTVTSGFIPDVPTAASTATDGCTVPPLVGTGTPKTKTGAEIDISTNTLISNGIDLEPSVAFVDANRPVLSQNPQPGTKLPCGKGLVTYTY
jgi:prepilin-type N-terminal cleavage/methylation domain-containing protein